MVCALAEQLHISFEQAENTPIYWLERWLLWRKLQPKPGDETRHDED